MQTNQRHHPGAIIAQRYEIVRCLGAGAVGAVLQVEDLQLDGQVFALKILHDGQLASNLTRHRLQAEVSIARQLSHPNIIRVYEFESIGGGGLEESPEESGSGWYVSMEYIDGCDLGQLLQQYGSQGVPFDEACVLLSAILKGLVFAHQKKVIHRDIKPENILVDRGGNAKLGDFGLAASLEDSMGFTRTGQSIGTPSYMAPELFIHSVRDPRVDIYSFGVLMYQMLTGVKPFEGETYYEVAKQHREIEADFSRLEGKGIPQETFSIIRQCLAKDREQRPANAQVIQAKLQGPQDSIRLPRHLSAAVRKRDEKVPFLRRPLGLLQTIWSIVVVFVICLPTLFLVPAAKFRVALAVESLGQFHGIKTTWAQKILGYEGYNVSDDDVLLRALEHEERHIIFFLANAGANLYAKNEFGRTVFHEAINYEVYRLSYLLDHLAQIGGPRVEPRDNLGRTPLHYAVYNKSISHIRRFIRAGFALNSRDVTGDSVIHTAVRTRDFDLLHLIFDQVALGSTENVVYTEFTAEGQTALHLAAQLVEPRMGHRLLEAKYSPDLRDSAGYTTVKRVVGERYTEQRGWIVESLLRFDADLNAVANDGMTLYTILHGPSQSEWREFFSQRGIQVVNPLGQICSS